MLKIKCANVNELLIETFIKALINKLFLKQLTKQNI